MKRSSSVWVWIHSLFILLGLAGAVAAAVGLAIYLQAFSHTLANSPGYEDIRFMRVPVLVMMESVLALFLAAAVLGFLFLFLVLRDKVFSSRGAVLLRLIGGCFFLMLIPCIALILYTRAHVAGSITNLWVEFGAGLALIAGNLFFLMAHQLQKGTAYKDENELTV